MKLEKLDPSLLKFTQKPGVLKVLKPDALISEAQGLHFLCPRCKKIGKEHAYTLLFNIPSVPVNAKPAGRYTVVGNNLTDVTVMERVRGVCGWHGCIREGEILSGDTTGDV